MMRRFTLTTLGLALAAAPAPALAQRTDDNATTSAEDAFGTSIGGEQIGIYNPNYVRGFSAAEAGNIRIDDSTEAVTIDRVRPQGRIRDVRPRQSRTTQTLMK